MNVRYTSNIQSFHGKIGRFKRVLKEKQGDALAEVCEMIFIRVVDKTPVRSGRARMNWNIQANSPDWFVDWGFAGGEQAATSAALAKLESAKAEIAGNPKAPVFITNGVYYMVFLEHGHSTLAPQGIVSVTLAEVKAALGG